MVDTQRRARLAGAAPCVHSSGWVQVHAEANALLNTNNSDVAGATIYVTMVPCNECAKLLIQAGIAEVVYAEVRALVMRRSPLCSGVPSNSGCERALVR